ncbi:MAG: LamG domain-containing protein, partial [Candidatus Binatia bacterium]
YEDGTVVERVETALDLNTGTLIACGVSGSVGGLVALPDTSLRFQGNRGGAVNPNSAPHDGGGAKQGLHLSHGDKQQTLDGGRVLEFQGVGQDRFEKAAMAFEGWFNTEQTTGTLLGWLSLDAPGLVLDLQTSGDGARLRLRTWEFTFVPLPPRGGLGQGTVAFEMLSGAGSVQLGRWHHVAFSYDGFHAMLYLDGVLVARSALRSTKTPLIDDKKTAVGIVIPTDGPVTLGRHPQPAQNQAAVATSLLGRMTEWRLYNRRLTAGAIIQRMFRRVSAAEIAVMQAEDGLVCCLHFDDGAGQTAADATTNNLDFTWDQQQVGTVALPPQLAWAPDTGRLWRGYPTAYKDIGAGILITEARSPGRETPPLSLDIDGEVIRVTDAPFNVTLPDGREFTGVGHFGTVSPIIETGDLVPTTINLGLSGIAAQLVSLALQSVYLDRPCLVYHVVWNDLGVMLDPFLLFEGKVDRMDLSLGVTGTVSIVASNNLKNWRRPTNLRWNDEGHRALYPDDYGFEFQAEMVDKQVWWPARVEGASPTTEEAV